MSRLNAERLHVRFTCGANRYRPITPRRYTLTHSDATGDLCLTIGRDSDRRQILGLHTRLLRDEVLAEWRSGKEGRALHIHCHVSGGVVLGSARRR